MSKPTAAEVIAAFQQMIDVLGFDAFMHRGWAQFYSGPDEEILKELFGRNPKRLPDIKDKKSNNKRSAKQAKNLQKQGRPTIRLDDTKIGQMVEAMKIYPFFLKAYFPDIPAAIEAADEVMRFLSREYTRAAFGHVSTAVCGALKDRVFRMTEVPELINNPKIETINGVPHKVVKEIYESTPHKPEIGEYRAFRLICLSEIRMARKTAIKEKSDETMNDYLDRKDFYHASRRHFLAASGSLTNPMIYRMSAKERRMRRALFKMSVWGQVTTSAALLGHAPKKLVS